MSKRIVQGFALLVWVALMGWAPSVYAKDAAMRSDMGASKGVVHDPDGGDEVSDQSVWVFRNAFGINRA